MMPASAAAGERPIGHAVDGILEAALYARDLDAAEAFYGGVLGLARIDRRGNRHLFFRVGQTILLIFNPDETARPPAPGRLAVPPHGATGPGHLCFRVPEETLDGIVAALVAAGHGIESDVTWPEGARSIYLRDPAGNSIEFADARLWGLDAAG